MTPDYLEADRNTTLTLYTCCCRSLPPALVCGYGALFTLGRRAGAAGSSLASQGGEGLGEALLSEICAFVRSGGDVLLRTRNSRRTPPLGVPEAHVVRALATFTRNLQRVVWAGTGDAQLWFGKSAG